jgi:glycosyltransferase involved in cell wall biosynthesis
MSLMKICIIQTYTYPLFNKNVKASHGGSELQLYQIAKELSKDDKYEISFIVGDFDQKKIEIINNIKIYKSFNPSKDDNLLKKIIQSIKYFNLFKLINADVYFTSTANSTVGLVELFCKLYKKKHIHWTAHDMDVDKSYIQKNGVLGLFYKYGLENSDVVLALTEYHKVLLKKNHKKNSVIFKLGYYINNVKKNVYSKKHILWVARFEKWKKPELFIELSDRFINETFIMICPNSDVEDDKYNELINLVNNKKNIKFIKYVEFKKIQNYFNNAKIFTNTSDFEGFPNTFIQAGIGRTPVVSLNVNPDNFITKNNCGYFCNGDFDNMVEKLNKLLNNKKDWEEKSNNIYKYVKENHNINNNIKLLNNIIFNLM